MTSKNSEVEGLFHDESNDNLESIYNGKTCMTHDDNLGSNNSTFYKESEKTKLNLG